MTDLVAITPAALEYLEKIAMGKGIKLSLKGGGCSGFKYDWTLIDDVNTIDPADTTYAYPNFILVLDGASIMFLLGSTVDYQETLVSSVLEVHSPLASASCGCGESVTFKEPK